MEENRVAIVTRAYSGIGRALCACLASEGYYLVIGGPNKKKLNAFAKELVAKTQVVPVVMDVTK